MPASYVFVVFHQRKGPVQVPDSSPDAVIQPMKRGVSREWYRICNVSGITDVRASTDPGPKHRMAAPIGADDNKWDNDPSKSE
jgi:hypothetical protein